MLVPPTRLHKPCPQALADLGMGLQGSC